MIQLARIRSGVKKQGPVGGHLTEGFGQSPPKIVLQGRLSFLNHPVQRSRGFRAAPPLERASLQVSRVVPGIAVVIVVVHSGRLPFFGIELVVVVVSSSSSSAKKDHQEIGSLLFAPAKDLSSGSGVHSGRYQTRRRRFAFFTQSGVVSVSPQHKILDDETLFGLGDVEGPPLSSELSS